MTESDGAAVPRLASRIATIVSLATGRRVLHLGCADWPYGRRRIMERTLLHEYLDACAAELTGVDSSQEGLEVLRSYNPAWKLVHGDAGAADIHGFDLIVATELVEHLGDPASMLAALRARAESAQVLLVITTPNAYALKGALRALVGREFCHPDHKVHFSTATLCHLLASCGWRVMSVGYYLAESTRPLLAPINWLLTALLTFLSPRAADGIVILAAPDVPTPEVAQPIETGG